MGTSDPTEWTRAVRSNGQRPRWQQPSFKCNRTRAGFASGWTCGVDPSGRQYYYNMETRQSQWEPPANVAMPMGGTSGVNGCMNIGSGEASQSHVGGTTVGTAPAPQLGGQPQHQSLQPGQHMGWQGGFAATSGPPSNWPAAYPSASVTQAPGAQFMPSYPPTYHTHPTAQLGWQGTAPQACGAGGQSQVWPSNQAPDWQNPQQQQLQGGQMFYNPSAPPGPSMPQASG